MTGSRWSFEAVNEGDQAVQFLYLLGVLVLVASAPSR